MGRTSTETGVGRPVHLDLLPAAKVDYVVVWARVCRTADERMDAQLHELPEDHQPR